MLGLLDRFRALFASEEMPGGPPILLDADAGTVDGVSLGAPLERVHEVWGPGRPPRTPLHTYRPVGASNMGAPPGKRGGDHIDVLQYPGMLVYVSARAGLYAALVWRSGTRTDRGVGAGDRLARVREAYPEAECAKQPPYHGAEGYKWCRVRLGERWLWFRDDPVRAIALTLTQIV